MVTRAMEYLKVPTKKTEIIIGIAVYVLSLAFQYGIFYARISAVEISIQEIKEDVHEIRNHVWASPKQ